MCHHLNYIICFLYGSSSFGCLCQRYLPNMVLSKYHIHCARWGNSKPYFPGFINDFKFFFSSLKKTKSKYAKHFYQGIAHLLLF